nr:MAG TPA: Initiation-control protein YabA, DnaA, DnaN, Zinc finger.7A [Caudoviricetes sp.]
MERLTNQWGQNHAVPTNFDLDFAFEMGDEEWKGLTEIFDRLAAYEDTGLTPEEIKALTAEVERLTKSNNIFAEENHTLYQQIATLEKTLDDEKCALLSACKILQELMDCENPLPICKGCQPDEDCVLHLLDYFIQQAQEQEGRNEP